MQHIQQQLNICKVQPGGWFVEQVECFTGRLFDQLPRQLDSLGFTTRESWGGLAEFHIVHAHGL